MALKYFAFDRLGFYILFGSIFSRQARASRHCRVVSSGWHYAGIDARHRIKKYHLPLDRAPAKWRARCVTAIIARYPYAGFMR
jgi:hypothetical protein